MKRTLRHILIFVLFIQTAMTLAVAQPQCVPFESLPAGETYGPPAVAPGDTLMTIDDVVVSFDLFQNSLGGNQFFSLTTTTTPFFLDFDQAEGTMLYLLNVGLTFDFRQLEDTVITLSFDYANATGKEKNLQVNDGPLHIISDFQDIPPEVAPGVFAYHTTDPLSPQEGILQFCGNIETLRLGGVQLHLDNLCYQTQGNTDPVWPGDADNNNVADQYDLLNIGQAFGSVGCPRDQIDVIWMDYPANDWIDTFSNGTNYKYADCNGDGVIDFGDVSTLNLNFGQTHDSQIAGPYIEGEENDPPLFADTRNPNANNERVWGNDGEPFSFPILAGVDTLPVDAIYGLAFTLEFDPTYLDPNSIDLDFDPNFGSWFGEENQDFVAVVNYDSVDQGIIKAALTRIDQINISGQGPVANMTGIIVDVVGFSEVKVTDVQAIEEDGADVIFQTPVFEFEVVDSITTGIEIIEEYSRNINVFPNPATDELWIKNSNQENIRSIKFYSALGQLIWEVNNPSELTNLSVSEFESGIYILEIKFDKFVVCKKLKIS